MSARYRQYKSLDLFREVFTLAEASAFMKGQNDRNWRADFDWMMKDANMPKVIEGRYSGQMGALPVKQSLKDRNAAFLAAAYERAKREEQE